MQKQLLVLHANAIQVEGWMSERYTPALQETITNPAGHHAPDVIEGYERYRMATTPKVDVTIAIQRPD